MTDFLPKDYQVPASSGNYMKLVEGVNEFRVLSKPVMGYEYWNTENKPVRAKDLWVSTPDDIKLNRDGSQTAIKHFWAFPVWNYASKSVQILEITQTTIMGAIQSLVNNPKWGSPQEYDLTVNRTGSGLDTEYSVMPNPKTPLDEEIKKSFLEKKINLEELFVGKDPFGSAKVGAVVDYPKDDINPDDIPF